MPTKETLQETIGKFIHKERKKQNMTLARLALLSLGNECYANKISRMEKGKTKQYSIETLNKILHALGFEFANLFK